MRAEEQAVKIRNQRGVGRCIVNRRSHYQAVTLGKELARFVHHVVKHAFTRLPAFPAADTAANGLVAHLYEFCLDALCFKNLAHFLQCQECIALDMRGPVHHHDLHVSISFFINM